MRAVSAVSLGLVLVLAGCGTRTVVYEPDPSAGYDIKLREPVAGDVINVTEALSAGLRQSLRLPGGGSMPLAPRNESSTITYVEMVVKAPAAGTRRPERFTRLYSHVDVRVNGRGIGVPFVNRTVVFERVGGKYRFTLDKAGPITGPGADFLERELNGPALQELPLKELLPGKPVKIQEEWDLVPERVARSFGAASGYEVEPSKAKGTGKLVKVYRKGTGQKGKVELKIVLEPKRSLAPPAALLEGGRVEIELELDTFIDGSSSSGQFVRREKINVSRDLDKKGRAQITEGTATRGTTIRQEAKP